MLLCCLIADALLRRKVLALLKKGVERWAFHLVGATTGKALSKSWSFALEKKGGGLGAWGAWSKAASDDLEKTPVAGRAPVLKGSEDANQHHESSLEAEQAACER